MTPTVPIPVTLRFLIESNNQLLKSYQQELSAQVVAANKECMQFLGLDPDEGWVLDMNTFTYVKKDTDAPPISE